MAIWNCLLVFILLQPIIIWANEVRNVYIDRDNGRNNMECLNSTDPAVSCHDLDWVFENMEAFDYTRFVLFEGKHVIKNQVPIFVNVTSVAFDGSNSDIICEERIGFYFYQVARISFYSVNFLECGALRNSTSNRFKMENDTDIFQVALYFESCSDIEMEDVVINSSYNTTGLVVYDGFGTNTFNNCYFVNNSVEEHDSRLEEDSIIGGGGGGVYVEFIFCRPGKFCEYSDKVINNARFEFFNCTFKDNFAQNWREGGFIYPQKMNHQAFSRGGGLSLYIRGNNSGNTFIVDECIFENNAALWGGGFFVELNDNAYGNTIVVNNSKFIRNKSPLRWGGGGGGLRLTHYIYESDSAHAKNIFIVRNSIFVDNWAMNGGGLSISWARQHTLWNNSAEFMLYNTIFESNLGRLGSAVYVDQFWKLTQQNGIKPIIEMTDCKFLNNSDLFYEKMPEQEEVHETGIGSVYLSSSSATFLNTAIFTSNEGSALAISDGNIGMEECEANFTDNRGSTGAAIVLLGASTLDIGKKTQMKFESNVAQFQGGAIYMETLSRQTTKSDANCFIRYPNWYFSDVVSMVFIGNKDHGGNNSNSIHATSILPCLNFVKTNNNSSGNTGVFCFNGWEYYSSLEDYWRKNNSECQQHINTDIGHMSRTSLDTIHATPGWEFELPINISDDVDMAITSEDVFFNLKQPESQQDVNSIIVCRKNVTIKAEEDSDVHFTLTAVGQRVWSMEISVEMDRCPPGFKLSDEKVCICDDFFNVYVECSNDTTKDAKIKKNAWMGMIREDDYQYYALDCPYHYCYDRNTSESLLKNDTMLCGYNRTGILCGECLDDYGTAINSFDYECIKCNNGLIGSIATYAALTYLPLCLLFTVIIIFDIRMTTGPANAFILYSQLITTMFSLDANGGIPLSKIVSDSSDLLMDIYKIPYDIFNLNIRINYFDLICLSPRMDTTAVFCLQYGIAFAPLLMILITITVLKVKECCCGGINFSSQTKVAIFLKNRIKNINNALLPAFATFILFSYTKFAVISSNLMRSDRLKGDNISRLYFAGQHDENSIPYKLYRSIGIIMFSVFVALTPLLLLDYPLRFFEWIVSQNSILTRLYPNIKIHILLDTFQGCYKKNARFFAGLYFLCRLVVTVAYSYCETWVERFVIQQLTITTIIILLALLRPYKVELNFVNYVDMLIFSNLAFLNCLSFLLYVVYRIDVNESSSKYVVVFWFQYLAVFLPLLYMICYLIWRLYAKRILHGSRDYQPLPNTKDFDSQIFRRSEKVNEYVGQLPQSDLNTRDINGMSEDTERIPATSRQSARLLKEDARKNSYQSTLQLEDSSKISEDNKNATSVQSSGMM